MALVVKNLSANAGDLRWRFHTWIRKIPWRREWWPTPVFSPGESHGQRSLEGYSPRGHKESDAAEVTAHTRVQVLTVLLFQLFCMLENFQNYELKRNFFWVKEKKKKTLLNYSLQWNGLLAGGHYYLANVFKAKALWQNKQASFLHRERNPSTSLCIPYILKNYWALKSIWLSIRGEKALVISFPGLFSIFILVYQY